MMQEIKGVFYSNVIILGKEGDYLSTVPERKANFPKIQAKIPSMV